MDWQLAGFLENVGNFLADGIELAFAFAAANDEVAGKCTDFPDVEQSDINSQFVTGGFNSFAGDFYRFQSILSCVF